MYTLVHLVVEDAVVSDGQDRMTYAKAVQQTLVVDMSGTYHVLGAARLNRVPAVVYASRNHVTGMIGRRAKRSSPHCFHSMSCT